MAVSTSQPISLETIQKLPEVERQLIGIISLYYNAIELGRLQSITEKLRLKNERGQYFSRVVLMQVLTRLQEKKLILVAKHSVVISPSFALKIAFDFCESDPNLFQKYSKLVSDVVIHEIENGSNAAFLLETRISEEAYEQFSFLRLLLLGLLSKDDHLAITGIDYYGDTLTNNKVQEGKSPFSALFRDQFSSHHLAFFSDALLSRCFQEEWHYEQLSLHSLDLTLLVDEMHHRGFQQMRCLGAVFEYYLFCDNALAVQQLLDDISDDHSLKPWLEASLFIYKGEFEQGFQGFIRIIENHRYERLEEMLFDCPEIFPFFTCALLSRGAAAFNEEITLIVHNVFMNDMERPPICLVIWYRALKASKHGVTGDVKKWLLAAQKRTLPISVQLYVQLMIYWFDVNTKSSQLKRIEKLLLKLEDSSLVWLKKQATGLFDKFQKTQLSLIDSQPAYLVDAYEPLPAWEWQLSGLESLNQALGDGVGSAKELEQQLDERIIWTLNEGKGGWQLSCRVQKKGKKRWSKGRQLPLLKLKEQQFDYECVSFLDRKILAKIYPVNFYYHTKGESDCEYDFSEILPLLMKHPNVYLEKSLEQPLTFEQSKAHLLLEETSGQVKLVAKPQIKHFKENSFYIELTAPNLLTFYLLNEKIHSVLKTVQDGIRVPRKNKSRMIQALSSVMEVIPLHSDVDDLPNGLVKQLSNPCLQLILSPSEHGLEGVLRVKPFEQSPHVFIPGHGVSDVIEPLEGGPCHYVRDKASEMELLHKLSEVAPGLIENFDEHYQWGGAGLEESLMLLDQAQKAVKQLDGEFLLLWPRGESIRLKSLESSDVQVRLKSANDWFSVEGDIQIDQGKVLSYQELLRLHQEQGQFIQLDDGQYLLLDDDLKRQLHALMGMTVEKDQQLVVHPLAAASFYLDGDQSLSLKGDDHWYEKRRQVQSMKAFKAEVPDDLNAKLRDYQTEGFEWLAQLAHWGVGACLADDMGLGKTIQSIALLLHRAAHGPALILAPTSVCGNWQDELQRFAPHLTVVNFQNERMLGEVGANSVTLCTYGLLHKHQSQLAEIQWSTLVLDEAQAIKNAASKRTRAVFSLYGQFRLALTGTPIENHLGELWSLFNFLNPGLLGSLQEFQTRYMTPIEKHQDEVKRAALRQMIQPFVLRRMKEQVLTELPERTEIQLSVPLSDDERAFYSALCQQAMNKFQDEEGLETKKIEILAELTRLRRACCHPNLVDDELDIACSKLDVLENLLVELKENGHRVLIFSQFVDYLKLIKERVEGQSLTYCYLDGRTPPKKRKQQIDAFQSEQFDVFLISLKAGGTGLNLTAADYVIHMDPWWNPAVEDQASDRAHRMGQTKPVTVYRLVSQETVEQKIVELHERKRDLADSLLQGTEVSGKLSADELIQLMSTQGRA